MEELTGINFSHPIPEGFQIYANTQVAGIYFRKADALEFAQGSDHELELERDYLNPKDKNAIKVIGISDCRKFFVGFVPKEIARLIVLANLFNDVKPRLNRIYLGTDSYLEIQFQIIGPKSSKHTYASNAKKPLLYEFQKDFFRFFNLPIPKDLTCKNANVLIKEYERKLTTDDPQKLVEYQAYQDILNDFDDKDFRDDYEIKKPSKKLLLQAMVNLINLGYSYEQLMEDIDVVVDELTKLNPNLNKSKEY